MGWAVIGNIRNIIPHAKMLYFGFFFVLLVTPGKACTHKRSITNSLRYIIYSHLFTIFTVHTNRKQKINMTGIQTGILKIRTMSSNKR